MRNGVFIVILLFFTGPLFGQQSQQLEISHHHGLDDSYPVHVTDIINTPEFIERAIEETQRRNPALYRRMLEKQAEPVEMETYELGDERSFYVLKFADRSGVRYTEGWFNEIEARLKAVGDKSYIWVEIEELENEHVTQTEVDAIFGSLEVSTPPTSQDPTKGIFELIEEYFGSPPNVGPDGPGTGEGKTNVLLTDIHDGWDPDEGGGFVAGFFFTLDQDINHNFSNQSDIIYIDTYPGIYNPIREVRNPDRPLSTLAHEYQHLVFHNYRGSADAEIWLNEGLSEFSEWFCGFSLRSPSRYFSNTNRSMNYWGNVTDDDVLQDYSRVALFTLYLWEQLGDEVLSKLVQLPASVGRGIQIVNRAADDLGATRRFPELLKDFNLANYIQDTGVDPRYGYDYELSGRPNPRQYHNNPGTENRGLQVAGYASYFIEYTLGDSLEIRFDTSTDLKIKAIEVGGDEKNVVPVSAGDWYVQYDYGDVYRTIMFVVVNQSSSTTSFDYESKGGFRYYVDEYKFDDGIPKQIPQVGANFLGLPGGEAYAGVGWAVKFEPEFPENQLLTARIYAAFEQEFPGSDTPPDVPKSFLFHVWDDDNGMPGEKLIEPFTVETTRSDFPGEFMDIELFDYTEELSDIQGPVYIGFTHGDEYSVHVGMTDLLPDENRTFAYFGPHEDQWVRMFDLTAGPDEIPLDGWNMMMRAVFAVYDPDRITEPIPDDFVLEQNYPNPFNQETTIQFSLPRDSQVKIEIYDVLGRRVKTLVDDFKTGGQHTAIWDATDQRGRVVSSGVYYYRLTGGDSAVTGKMIFLR